MSLILKLVVRIAVSAAALYFVLRSIDLAAFWERVKGMNLAWLILALAVFSTTQVIAVWRWNRLLRAQHVEVEKRRLTESILVDRVLGCRDSCNRDPGFRRSLAQTGAGTQPAVGDRTRAAARRCGVALQKSARHAGRRVRRRDRGADHDCGLLFADCPRAISPASTPSGRRAHAVALSLVSTGMVMGLSLGGALMFVRRR